MKIADIKGYELSIPSGPYDWSHTIGPARGKRNAFFTRVIAEDGTEGNCISIERGSILSTIFHNTIKPLAIGAGVHDRERLWQQLLKVSRSEHYNFFGMGAFDVALWDLAAKQAKLPLYKYIGAYRDKILAYASTFTFDSIEAYQENCKKYVKQGYKAIKLHVHGIPDVDIEICRAVREAVGPDIKLMLDVSGAYDQMNALRVGRELEKLNFLWYEEPLRDFDLHGLKQLNRKLEIPLCTAEQASDINFGVANHILHETSSMVHASWAMKAGITGLMKIAHTAESFGLSCQVLHSEIPGIHTSLCIKSCTYFESIVPEEAFHLCVKNPLIVPDSEGYIHPPEGPGLGLDIDWDVIDNHTVQEI
ncbi:MAG: enolase C-terminal domain-like protein [Bacteroidota bacterium]